jgi:predicted Zn-dependent peptidase
MLLDHQDYHNTCFEYIANQYSKLYFEGVSVFDMLDIIDNITLDSINETATKFLNINNMVQT